MSQPSDRTPAVDVVRLIARLIARCPPSYAYYTKPESLEIMLRLLIVALPLVVALPAAFDEQEATAIQFEVQSPLQFEVRSPPDSRPLLPAAPQEINTTPHTPLRTHNTHAHTSPCTRRGTRARARRPIPRSTSSPTSSSPGTPTLRTQVCPRPGRQQRMQRSFRSALPLRAGAQDRTRARAPSAAAPAPTYEPAERRASLRATQLALAIGTC